MKCVVNETSASSKMLLSRLSSNLESNISGGEIFRKRDLLLL